MSINIQDVTLMEQIIRACQARGAFTPVEMKDVGILYEKLTKVIKESKQLPVIPETPEQPES